MFSYYFVLFLFLQIFLATSKEEAKSDEAQGRHFGFGNFFNGFRRNRHQRFSGGNRGGNRGGRGRITFEEQGGRPFKPDALVAKPSRSESTFPASCGITKEILAQRIVGGRPAAEHEFPWQVSIQVNHLPTLRGEFTQYCGGAILNERWVVTAAHCMTGVSVGSMKGIIGANDISDLEPGASEVFFDKSIVHEKYNDKILQHKYDNDVALLHTTTRMQLTKDRSVNAVCLPKTGQTFSGSVSVTGWGRVTEGGSKSEKLRTVDVKLLDDENCKKAYKTLFNSAFMMCAGDLKGGKDSCQADSGGPLVKLDNEKSYLAGIVSFGIGCARKGNPGSYTKVSHYTDWITKKIRENS